ncbi:MAG: hypothetical protein KDB95_08740 [Flavobacteriales bacterium]|nr:hypothetical protein [Flavobacteriales bacterium]
MTERTRNVLTLVLLLALVLPAYLRGVAILYDLDRPPDVDLLRDVGAAQNILDGGYGKDPIYLGETAWYPPLLSVILAGLSSMTGSPVMVVAARAGIHLDLLPLAAFAFLLWRSFGRIAALFGVAGYLYLVHDHAPAWLAPSLSPYLFAICFMHGAFCIGLYLAFRLRRPSAGWSQWCAAGALVAITFVGHPSTAMILCLLLGGVGASQLLKVLRDGPARLQQVGNLTSFLIIAAIGAWILLAPMIEAYGMERRNPFSTTWQMEGLLLKDLPGTLLDRPLLVSVLIAFGFFVSLRRRDSISAILLYATAIITGLLLWSSVSAELANTHQRSVILSFVPAYHFVFYLELMGCLFFAIGSMVLVKWAIGSVRRWIPSTFYDRVRHRFARPVFRRAAIMVGILALMVLLPFTSSFLHRKINSMVNKAASRPADPYAPSFDFIHAGTAPMDVFLTQDRVAMDLISPAGRKLVATDRYFSNPYVDLAPRAADRDSMLTFIREDRVKDFLTLAAVYSVDFVIPNVRPSARWNGILSPVHEDPRIRIYRLERGDRNVGTGRN